MKRDYTFIHPDVKKGEIAAVAELLADSSALPSVAFMPARGSPIERLAGEFASYLLSSLSGPLPDFAVELASRNRWKDVPVGAVCLSSATASLYSLLTASGAKGGEVVTTSLNFPGVINAILLAGAIPRFVDIEPESFCMDISKIEAALGKKTRAVIVTHFNRCVDIGLLARLLAESFPKIPLIQDASLAHASKHGGLPAGLMNPGRGGATVFSLASSKIISGLGGAVVVSNELKILEQIFAFAYQGMPLRGGEQLSMTGFNFKMNDMNAAIALSMLSRRQGIFARRRRLKALYDSLLAPLVDAGKISLQDVGCESIVTHYGIQVSDRLTLAGRMLQKHGIQMGMWYVHHKQRIYRGMPWTRGVRLPVTESVGRKLAFLPFHTQLSDEDVEFICRALAREISRR